MYLVVCRDLTQPNQQVSTIGIHHSHIFYFTAIAINTSSSLRLLKRFYFQKSWAIRWLDCLQPQNQFRKRPSWSPNRRHYVGLCRLCRMPVHAIRLYRRNASPTRERCSVPVSGWLSVGTSPDGSTLNRTLQTRLGKTWFWPESWVGLQPFFLQSALFFYF